MSLLKTMLNKKSESQVKKDKKFRKFGLKRYEEVLEKIANIINDEKVEDNQISPIVKDLFTERIVIEKKLLEAGVTEDELKEYRTRILKQGTEEGQPSA